MIVYFASKAQFSEDVASNQIERKIADAFLRRLGRKVGPSEYDAWKNSLMYMRQPLADAAIPDDVNVAIEYKIPNTSKRIDFILSGQTQDGRGSILIVELKQWATATKTEMDGIVQTALGRGMRDTPHPSYQAWTYASMLTDFNSSVQDLNVQVTPCAYLHNCISGEGLRGF